MKKTTVLIAGAGPAGAATALALRKRGIPCIVAERSPLPVFKAGETIAPNAIPLFHKLGMEQLFNDLKHLISYGNRFAWGSEQQADKIFLSGINANGYHIDRMHFESQLLDQLNNEGTELLRGWSIVNCKKETNGWTVTMLDPQNNREELFCEFIVDATGRPCRIARALGIQRARLDLLTGIAACFTLRKFNKPHYTYIEAVEQGWWYAAPLTGMRLATTFMTDTDLLDPLILNADHYLETISSTTMIADLLVGGITSKDIQITSCTASTSYLEKRFGDGWLAVGDAAFAYDPISSYGITSALDGGYYAGNAIADTLDGYKEALPAYDWLISGAFTIYKEMYQHQYQLEQRWPQGAFWKRRHDMA